jgi:SAM-dependent methyltransferase
VLNDIPPLHDQFTSISIHFAGVRCCIRELHHARNGAPAPSNFADFSENQVWNVGFARSSYDLIFGIAVIEHLPNLETILGECVKILNTNGRIALHGAAFWSSNLGHHVFVHIDKARYEFNANNPIDDFSHIYFSKQEMETHLIEVKQLPATHAAAIVNYIYDNPILNRYHYEDILSSYKRAGLEFSYFRHSNWKTPTSDTLDRIQARLGPYFSQIYNNYSCGELLLIASVN